MTNAEIRAWYQREVSKISRLNETWIERGLDLRERARLAWQIRHNARLQARFMMENPDEVELLRARDRALYGNPDGPTFDGLLVGHRAQGLTIKEAYTRIIQGSQETNRKVDEDVRKKPAQP